MLAQKRTGIKLMFDKFTRRVKQEAIVEGKQLCSGPRDGVLNRVTVDEREAIIF